MDGIASEDGEKNLINIAKERFNIADRSKISAKTAIENVEKFT